MNLFDGDEFIRAWRIVHREGDPVEVRIFSQNKREGVLSGYFTDPERAADALDKINLSGRTVTWTINRLHPGCYARVQREKLLAVSPTTADGDVIQRLWLPIDIDADRPSGCSASEEERLAAVNLAVKMAETLTAEGWPEPLKIYSGNGAHLFFPMDAENNKNDLKRGADIVNACLVSLARRFDSQSVHIDTTVSNAARIMKCPGTTACKGSHAPDLGRPWRMARLFEDCVDYVRPEEVVTL